MIKLLLKHLEALKDTYKDNSNLTININLAWLKLKKYYKLIDVILIYPTALFLYLNFQFKYFKKR